MSSEESFQNPYLSAKFKDLQSPEKPAEMLAFLLFVAGIVITMVRDN